MAGGGGLTRRAVVAGALGAPLLALGAGPRAAIAQAETDTEVLVSAVGFEQVSAFAYRAAARSGRLDAAGVEIARAFEAHERAHVGALRTSIEALGGTVPPPPRTLAEVDRVLPGFGDARTGREVLTFAVELESAAVATYHDVAQKLRDPDLLRTAVSIMASEAQHLAVLRRALGQPPVPLAFETGQR